MICPTLCLAVVAQTAADPTTILVGSSGWAGAGLLGLVLGWLLLVHIPAKDKQIKDLIAEFRVESKEQREAAKMALTVMREALQQIHDKMREDYRQERMEDRASCDRRNDLIVRAIEGLMGKK